MSDQALVLIVLPLAVLAYLYLGYPALLWLIVKARGTRHVRRADITPSMSLVISAYNEEAVIGQKLGNAIALDYPPGLLEIVVISDASSDGTDDIVRTFDGVKLFRQSERRGKTAGLNRTLPLLSGELVVFSDANAMYEPDTLRKLARNFADPEVGCVTGEARYTPGRHATADLGERVYWDYEKQIKRLETAIGSMVGGDGAIYGIRRSLWRELPEDAINDFLNPLQIVVAGWRAVYEPEAVCYEEPGGGIGVEYGRRVRIVSRSWRAIFQEPGALNPLRTGVFAWSVVSHKVLRWFSGVFGAAALCGAFAVGLETAVRKPLTTLVAALVALGVTTVVPAGRRAAGMLGYFAVVNAASLVGLVKGSAGRVSGVWSTPRASAGPGMAGVTVPVGLLFLLVCATAALGAVIGARLVSSPRPAAIVFWSAAVLMAYVYVGYPALLAGFGAFFRRPVQRRPIEPSVCLLIAANDEAAVIEAKLRNALALDYPEDKLDIVVASDGSLDDTNSIVGRFAPRVRLFDFSPRRGKIAAINEGMRAVSAEIVVFSDANTFLQPEAVRALVANFADPKVGAVSGDVALVGDRALLAQSEDLYYRYERWVQQGESGIGSMIGVDGALYAIRRRLFVAPAEDTILDDMAIPMAVVRAGYRVVFEPAALAHEQGSGTATEEFARKARVIAGAVQFMARRDSAVPLGAPQVMFSMISHKALRWLSPVFAISAFLSSVVLAASSQAYLTVVMVQAVVLAFGTAGCVPTLRRASIIAVSHYFCLVQTAAAVGFARGLTGRQSVLWRRFHRAPLGLA